MANAFFGTPYLSSLALSLLSLAALKATEPGEVTDFESLKKLASELAHQPYKPVEHALDPFFEGLKYDGHRQIRFRPDKALFGGEGQTFRMEFFHPGWMFKKPVGFFDIKDGKNAPVSFDRGLFDYGELKVPESAANPPGFAGFRVLAPDALADRRFEFLVFMGASYFRAVTTELGYGLSARGIAVNTIGGAPEEFPDFTHFWFMHPKEGEKSVQILALLNGPSITGAYHISALPGETTEMFVRTSLYVRKPVKMLGIAPFSSMFWFGENSHPKPYDFRPEVHDSDGLQVEIEGGPSIWRALDVGKDMRLSLFETDKLKGFGLAERDRDFANFQDLEAAYHNRPAVWVQPLKGFGKGAVTLVELSTGEETWDNIVAMWSPEKIPSSPDEPLEVEYRLDWLREHLPGTLARVVSTRRGFVMDSDDHLYVVDFSPAEGDAARPKDWLPEVKVTTASGVAKVLDQRVMKNPETGGWRAFFKLDIPDKTNLLELTCELKDKEKVISERWSYQWRRQ